MVDSSFSPVRRDLGEIILRNMLAVTAGTWASKLVNFFFIIYVVRVLGEVGLGRYATVVAFVGLFGVFFELGMAQYVERSIAQDPNRAQSLFWNLVVLRFILAVAGVAAITALATVFGYDRRLVIGIFLFTLTFIMAAIQVPMTTVLTANERFDLSSASKFVNQTLTMIFGVMFLWFGAGFYALLYTGFIALPVQIALTLWMIRHYELGPLRFEVEPQRWPAFVRASLPFGLTSLALTFNFNVDTVILGLFHDDSAVGWYNASYRLVFNAVGIVGGFLVVMTPSLAREYQLDSERVHRWVRRSLYWMIFLSLPASVGLSILAVPVIGLLFGSSYAPAAPVLTLIAWDISLLLLNSYFGNVTAAIGLERPGAWIFGVAAILNLVLNLALIPAYGMIAAAGVTVFTDLLSVVCFYVLLRERSAIDQLMPQFVRMAIATGLMAAVMLLASPFPLALVISFGALVYLLLAFLMRLVDVPWMIETARRVTRRSSGVSS